MKKKIVALAAFAALTIPTGCNIIGGSIADGILKLEVNLPKTGTGK